MLKNYWNNLEKMSESEDREKKENIQSLGHSKEGGIIRHLITVNSQQKESLERREGPRQETKVMSLRAAFHADRICKSIECQSPPKPERLSLPEKENLFTDPKLLEMIRKDLEDINKLKQSTLKETIKYSFLYSDNIFSSVQSATSNYKRNKIPLGESDGN